MSSYAAAFWTLIQAVYDFVYVHRIALKFDTEKHDMFRLLAALRIAHFDPNNNCSTFLSTVIISQNTVLFIHKSTL